jgi:ADP-dependent NAD(P)H-hydrate dehydratase / NAD(P)H-hydrate epimerase
VIYVLTSQEMRDADAAAIARSSDITLMSVAGARIADYVRTHWGRGRVVAFAGPGNNGGDAFAALSQMEPQYDRVVYASQVEKPPAARAEAEARARAAGVTVRPLPTNDGDACAALNGAVCALDGLFGTGARLPMGEAYRAAARGLDARRLPVVAIDIPSGIDADTGAVGNDAVRASATITLAALKPGLLLDPSRLNAGELWLADIGIDDDTLHAHARTFATLDDAAFLAMLPRRSRDATKRSAGAPLVIAGSAQFPGAAVLCALGAARAGAGYVTVATPAAAAATLQAHLVEQVVVRIPETSPHDAAEELLDVARRNSAVAIGPGLAMDDWTGEMVREFLTRCELPFVADASAFYHLTKQLKLLRGKQCVLTPHAGEFARLSGRGTVAPGERVPRLREFVQRTGITTLLKGPDTLVYDGTTMHINPTGTNALATAGTGDVLTGMTGTLLSQGLSPFDAARMAAYWHGLAAQYCQAHRRVGVIAGDLPDALAEALPIAEAAMPLRRLF